MSGSAIFESFSTRNTEKYAKRVARLLEEGDVVLFLANLGAGKTTFIQGLAKALGVHEKALSPTFVIAQTLSARFPIHHLDFYRLSAKEILDMGIQDYLVGGGAIEKGLVLIEWAERCSQMWPKERLEVRIRVLPKTDHREIKLTGRGKRYEDMVRSLRK